MEPKFFVGVDLSKLTMDLALLHRDMPVRSFKIDNTEEAVKNFLKEIKAEYGFKSREIVFCAENMGIYSDYLTKVLISKKINIYLESALQIQKSLGIRRGKSDKLDAVRIVEYARKNYPALKIWDPPRTCIEQLKKLTTIRKRLIKIKKMLTNEEKVRAHFLNADERKALSSCYERSLHSVIEDIKGIDDKMNKIVLLDERLSHLVALITSVPFIGKIIAFHIIISTNEFKNINSAKKFASYCGVAPFEWTSGTSLTGKPRVSVFANKEIKAYLHMAAMGSIRRPGNDFMEYYVRKQKEGKNNMAILNALRNKLLHRIFACVNHNEFFTWKKM
jgi:transposase